MRLLEVPQLLTWGLAIWISWYYINTFLSMGLSARLIMIMMRCFETDVNDDDCDFLMMLLVMMMKMKMTTILGGQVGACRTWYTQAGALWYYSTRAGQTSKHWPALKLHCIALHCIAVWQTSKHRPARKRSNYIGAIAVSIHHRNSDFIGNWMQQCHRQKVTSYPFSTYLAWVKCFEHQVAPPVSVESNKWLGLTFTGWSPIGRTMHGHMGKSLLQNCMSNAV